MIGLVLPLLILTTTIWFLLDHKRNVSDGVVNGIGTLFSLDHKLYASDYDSDSDSVAGENQPLAHIVLIRVKLSFYGVGLSTHFRARVKRCLGLNTSLQRLAFT